MRRLLPLFIILACRDDSLGPPPPPGFDATGDWTYNDQVRDPNAGITCTNRGVFSFVVAATALTGQGNLVTTCSGPGGTATDSGMVSITSGMVSGSNITLQVDPCVYQGTLFSAGAQIRASGSVSCDIDVGGPVIRLRGSWNATYVVDATPPVVTASLRAPAGDTVAVPGDTVTVTIHASDGRKLAFVGYAMTSPVVLRESTAVSGATADVVMRRGLPPAGLGSVHVTAFARDSAGFSTTTALPPLTIIDMLRRPTRALTIPAAVTDITLDTKRGVVYLAYFGRRELGVVNIATGTFATSIVTTFPPRKLDMSVGNDSVIASVDSQPALGIVNLAANPHTLTIVRVDSAYSGGLSYRADNVRAMANNKVMVTLAFRDQYSCCSAYHVDYDLGTGLSTRRVDSDHTQWLARSWDRTVMVTAAGSSTPVRARIYVAAADTFAAFRLVDIPVWLYHASADSTGTRFLLANALFDGGLNPLRAFTDTAFAQGGGTVLTADGATAYLATYNGYVKVRTADGAVLERVRLPFWAFRLGITADGGTLIAVGGTPEYFQPPNNQVLLITLH